MEKALKMKEKQEAVDKEIAEINRRNFESMKERCLVDVQRKGEEMNFLGRLHKERLEALQEENILRAQEARELLPQQISQTQRLAEGVLRLKNKEIREQKHRQVLRSGNIELTQLEAQLKSTYAAKAAQVQLRERKASREDERHFENEASASRARWYNDDAFDRRREAEEREKKARYRTAIHDQLISNELSRRERAEDDHRERKIVEEVSEILHKENLRLDNERRVKITHVRAERDAFFRAKEIWKCKEKEALFDEFNRQTKIIADKMTEEHDRVTKKSDVSRARDNAMERTARKMLDDEVKRGEREDIVNQLIVEERNNEVARDLKNEVMKKELLKRELLADMERQKELIARSRDQETMVDRAFGKYLAEQYDIALRGDREKQEERSRKGIQYGKDLKAVREEQRALYAEETMLRQAIQRQDEEQELQRLKEVALERSKMLYEHAPKLVGFLKAGTLGPEDY